MLVNAGAEVDALDNCGTTPLGTAFRSGNLKLIKFLLSVRASTTIVNKKGNTILELAIKSGQRKTVDKVAEICLKHSMTAYKKAVLIYKAVRRGFYSYLAVKWMKTLAVDINTPDEYGDTLLHKAVFQSKWDGSSHKKAGDYQQVMFLLIKLGANVNQRNNEGNTFMHYFAAIAKDDNEPDFFSDLNFIANLLKAFPQINLNISNNWGATLLYIALCSLNIDAAILFIKHGASANITPAQSIILNRVDNKKRMVSQDSPEAPLSPLKLAFAYTQIALFYDKKVEEKLKNLKSYVEWLIRDKYSKSKKVHITQVEFNNIPNAQRDADCMLEEHIKSYKKECTQKMYDLARLMLINDGRIFGDQSEQH